MTSNTNGNGFPYLNDADPLLVSFATRFSQIGDLNSLVALKCRIDQISQRRMEVLMAEMAATAAR